MILEGGRAGGVCIEKSIPRGRGGGSVLKNQFEGGGWGGSELSDQLLDPDVPTLASQDKLKVSPKGLPFVITRREIFRKKEVGEGALRQIGRYIK